MSSDGTPDGRASCTPISVSSVAASGTQTTEIAAGRLDLGDPGIELDNGPTINVTRPRTREGGGPLNPVTAPA